MAPGRTMFVGPHDGGATTLYSNGGRGGGGRKNSSGNAVLFPLLLLVALFFYVLGFVQSIRSLPDIADADPGHRRSRFQQKVVMPLVERVDKRDFLRNRQRRQQQQRPVVPPEDRVNGEAPGDGDRRANNGRHGLRGDSPPEAHGGDDAATGGAVVVPPARWPVSVRDGAADNDGFETIVHPADPHETMRVPKFWSDGSIMGHDGPLMSREVADRIGTYDTSNGKVEGSPESRTIFVAIASYRDFQCRQTVESIFSRAKHPERVRVVVVDQIDKVDVSCNDPVVPCKDDPDQALCKWKDRIDVYEMESRLAVGPVFARHIGHRMYRGEYYAMQIDAHVTYATDWDVDVVSQMDATKNDMAVLSTYLSDIKGSLDPKTGRSTRRTRPIMCNTAYERNHQGAHLRHLSQPERPAPIRGTPQLQPYWAAGFSFSRGHFVANVPYDRYQPMVFQGEESGIAVRAFTYGYDLYAPERSVCFHTYAEGENKVKRNKVPKYWEHSQLYQGVGIGGMKRLLGVIGMLPEEPPSSWNHAEEDKYGVGSVRPVSKFYETFGIDVNAKKCEKNLCSFVATGVMHTEFTKHLRPDGMGIDYTNIDYKFRDPEANGK